MSRSSVDELDAPLPETVPLIPAATSAARQNASASKVSIPNEYLCPITQELMTDPVVITSGHTYERTAIETWLQDHDTCPLTKTKLRHKTVTPNHTLKKLIGDFCTTNNIALPTAQSTVTP